MAISEGSRVMTMGSQLGTITDVTDCPDGTCWVRLDSGEERQFVTCLLLLLKGSA